VRQTMSGRDDPFSNCPTAIYADVTMALPKANLVHHRFGLCLARAHLAAKFKSSGSRVTRSSFFKRSPGNLDADSS
jgi:hypothetical protein